MCSPGTDNSFKTISGSVIRGKRTLPTKFPSSSLSCQTPKVFVLKGFFEYRKTVAFDSEENKFPQEDAFSGSVPFSSSS